MQADPARKPKPELILIAAVASNGVIGRANGLVFQDAADMRHFRQVTLGFPVIMGRKTWESLPERFRPLPGRRNIVVSHNPMFMPRGAELAASLEDALLLAANAPKVFVVGGGQLYAQALPHADALLLTEVSVPLEGETHFPAWDRQRFQAGARNYHTSANGVPYTITEYRRVLD